MQFDLVSPERSLASFQVNAVQIPGADGDMTAMPGHTPVITTLRPGVLKAEGPDGAKEYVVSGGFAEINATGLSMTRPSCSPTWWPWAITSRSDRARMSGIETGPLVGPVLFWLVAAAFACHHGRLSA